MGFENQSIRELDQRSAGEHPVIVQTYEKARQILKDDAIDPRNFADLYGEENVNRDLKKIETIKSKFEDNDIKHVADVFEAIVYQHTELSDWLGQNAETIRPSEYDDVINGIDLIVEFNSEDFTKHLALGIDITFGSHTISEKFERIRNEIINDELAKVKYFESHEFKGSLKQVPRVVIGLEKDNVIALAALWMRGENAELGNHFAKDIIMREILEQLQAFLAYAQQTKSESAIRSYNQALSILKSSTDIATPEYNERMRTNGEEIRNDRVFKDIQRQLNAFKNSSTEG